MLYRSPAGSRWVVTKKTTAERGDREGDGGRKSRGAGASVTTLSAYIGLRRDAD